MGHRQYRCGAATRGGHGFYGGLCRNRSDLLLSLPGVHAADRLTTWIAPATVFRYPRAALAGTWLENNVKQAELKPVEGGDAAFEQFVHDKMEALASLRPRLVTDAAKVPGSRILAGQFASVQQAIGINKGNEAAYHWFKAFVEASKANGLVARLIEQFGVQGQLSVAPLA